MLVTNFKVFITKNGDGAILYTKKNILYKVVIPKKNEVLIEIFLKYFRELKPFKNRHYAIAKWIARDIRAKGYLFKSYANNKNRLRPVKINKSNFKISKGISNDQIMENMHNIMCEKEFIDIERLLH